MQSLLLHTCCLSCVGYHSLYLAEQYDLTLFYFNPNIFPYKEYQKRRDDVQSFAKQHNIKFIEYHYDHQAWLRYIKPYRLWGERSYRCYLCYEYRIAITAEYASSHNYNMFSTILSVSPYKLSRWILAIGKHYANIYNISFLDIDFKKKDGYKKSIQYAKAHNCYIQNYCGCPFSKREYILRTKNKTFNYTK